MLFGKIILQRANVIILDEPTNHLDMESIESLNHALNLLRAFHFCKSLGSLFHL